MTSTPKIWRNSIEHYEDRGPGAWSNWYGISVDGDTWELGHPQQRYIICCSLVTYQSLRRLARTDVMTVIHG